MTTASVQVVSIRDKAAYRIDDREFQVLAIDVRDILQALEPLLQKWIWCITDLECNAETHPLIRHFADPNASYVWLSSAAFVQLSAAIEQTIDGTFVAFPRDIDTSSVQSDELDLAEFPASRAELAICAGDSSFFEVYGKDARTLDLIRGNFKVVRNEDPARYFGTGEQPA
jgi:hypothetical protein